MTRTDSHTLCTNRPYQRSRAVCASSLEVPDEMLLSLTAALSWPPPNLENPETLAPANTVIISTLHIIVTILLVIRLYSRRQLSGGLRLDDLLIVLAYVSLFRLGHLCNAALAMQVWTSFSS